MYCPRCGEHLTIYSESHGYSWLYRQYVCKKCKLIWDWASRIRGDNFWRIEECKAWEAVGLDIIKEYEDEKANVRGT